MMRKINRILWCIDLFRWKFQKNIRKAGCLGLALFASALTAQSSAENGVGPFRTQTIELSAGWNAVYLEVEPLSTEPTALFANTPIEIAAAYFRPTTAMEFITSPGEILPDRKSWNVWYAPERDDTLLSNLHAIQAHRAYLVYTEVDYTWNLEGVIYFNTTQWHPNTFSLVGFHVNGAEQPSIANFFAGADAHTPLKVYRMIAGRWALVTAPQSTLIEPGVAYWAQSKGASDFSGPLEVYFEDQSTGGLIFNESGQSHRLVIRNRSIYPQRLTFKLNAGSDGTLPLAYMVRIVNGPNQPIESEAVAFTETLEFGPLEAGQSFAMDLQIIQEQVTAALASSSLSIASDAGNLVEVPIISVRRDLL